ncbi:hypothetical protein NP493_758g00009 [Ridgeia piscesae]|uniref:Fibronectin type-III domain-containing protein n=1 Tax=Ridgeia piscesae TaxID=27915 RepID=A0AAD9KPD9_RIDPI|nr:hypothetical protein NP493_758g00009 [Ridgeia piscesae]
MSVREGVRINDGGNLTIAALLRPARKPHSFTILSNRTLVALTLQWHPGFDGGHPPQTFTLQYRASTEVTLRTWRDIFSHTTDGVTRHQATVTGLRPQTEYVFSLYAENSRPPAQGPNKSETVTLIGSTIGLCCGYGERSRSPQVLDLYSVNSSLFAERIFPRSGSYGLTMLHNVCYSCLMWAINSSPLEESDHATFVLIPSYRQKLKTLKPTKTMTRLKLFGDARTTTSTTSRSTTLANGGTTDDEVVGIALGGVAFLSCIFCMKIFVFCKRKRQDPPPPIRQSQRLMGRRAQASGMMELDQPSVSGPVNAAAEPAVAATHFATAAASWQRASNDRKM